MPVAAVLSSAVLSLAVLAAGASSAPPPLQAPSGGAAAGPAPSVTSLACRKHCLDSRPQPGSTVAMRGSALGDVRVVRFLGTPAARDAVVARPLRTSERRLLVVVPAKAARGRALLTSAGGTVSRPSPVVPVIRPPKPRDRGGPIATVVTGRKAFFDARRKPTLTFSLTTGRAAAASVQVVREADGVVVASFDQGVVKPGEQRSVAWDGTVGGIPQPDGRYAFVVSSTDVESGATASTAQVGTGGATHSAGPRSADAFMLLGHRFPVRGKHDYGGFAASFGGGRGHEGHDVFAACGTPLVAARGGVVKMKRFQSRAGNYIVVDGAGTDVDMAYMHLRDPALVEQRQRIRTGQLIGYVGDTGRASGCHLHFEMWSGPGWYTGGSPFDPLPHLRAWDAVS